MLTLRTLIVRFTFLKIFLMWVQKTFTTLMIENKGLMIFYLLMLKSLKLALILLTNGA